MGDKHVCSFCSENLEGKQHIKIVFENWPVEEEVIYRRKGKEARKTRKTTKEVITAIGMECIQNPDRWKDFEIDPAKVADFFEDLRFAGKNPVFRAVLARGGPVCLSADCGQRTGSDCRHMERRHSSDFYGLDELSCEVGHPGKVLVRKERDERLGILNLLPATTRRTKWWETIWNFVSFAWKPEHGWLTRIYFAVTYTLPMFFMLILYVLVAYPFWGLLCLKGKVAAYKILRA